MLRTIFKVQDFFPPYITEHTCQGFLFITKAKVDLNESLCVTIIECEFFVFMSSNGLYLY